MKFSHAWIERNPWLLIALVTVVISIGGADTPLPTRLRFAYAGGSPLAPSLKHEVEKLLGTALQLEGRDIYIREGCVQCHSQMIRPFRAETERYGHYSVAGESVWDHPFLWGSKRTGPDLARVGARYSDDWHRAHLYNPRNVVPESKMPAYPWLVTAAVDSSHTETKLKVMRTLGVPYTDDDINGAVARPPNRVRPRKCGIRVSTKAAIVPSATAAMAV